MAVKILWPDGPRYVSEEKIILAAIDALCNEEGADLDTLSRPTLEEAIEIVNHWGYYTTASLGSRLTAAEREKGVALQLVRD